jgi:hypothetical protein
MEKLNERKSQARHGGVLLKSNSFKTFASGYRGVVLPLM